MMRLLSRTVLCAVMACSPVPVWSASVERATQNVSGLITGLIGSPLRAGPGPIKSLSLGERVAGTDVLETRQDEMVEILWDRRALILLQPQSSLTIAEPKPGDTRVGLRDGSVRVALAYGGRATDVITVETAASRTVTRGGIVEVDARPRPPSLLAMVASMFALPPAVLPQRVDSIRVLEGQSGVEPVGASGRAETIEAGFQALVVNGSAVQVTEQRVQPGRGAGLAAIDRRQETPRPLTERLMAIHVNHALEVERLLNVAPGNLEESVTKPGTDVRGTIVSTSLGIPAASLGGAQTGGQAGPTAPPVTSPLPTLPPIQPPTVTTLSPSQSGGLNSRNLLRDILREQRDRERDRERDRDRRRGRDD